MRPVDILSQGEEGKDVLEKLLSDGYFEITEGNAILYLESFFNGEKINMSKQEALTFILSPPAHPYNLTYGSDSRKGTKKNLAQDGFLIENPEALYQRNI